MSEHAPCTGVHRLSPGRIAGRSEFADLKAAARAGSTLVPSWAARWGVAEQTVRSWYDATEHTGVVGAGDLNALEPADLLPLLERWVDSVRARLSPARPATDPRHIVLESTVRVGAIARKAIDAVADGVCDEREWADIESECARAESEMRAAKLAARAAREGAK